MVGSSDYSLAPDEGLTIPKPVVLALGSYNSTTDHLLLSVTGKPQNLYSKPYQKFSQKL